MTTTLIGLAVLVAVVLVGLLLARVLGRVLFGAGKTPTAKEMRRAAKEGRWTHGQGGGF